MCECAVSSSPPPQECVPNNILSREFSVEKMFPDSTLENNDALPELSGKRPSRRNADEVLSDLSDTRNGDSPIISCSAERNGDAAPITPMGAPAVDVILSNTASAIDEGRSPCPLVALPDESVRSPTPNLDLSTDIGGGDWGINCSFDLPIGMNALPLPTLLFGVGDILGLKARKAVPWVLIPPVECRRKRGSESGGIANRSLSSVEYKKGRSSCSRDMPGGDAVAHRCLLAVPVKGTLS
mmetsp:Transcript_6842/g.15647  ORF Transcript_6842/g.15647 Transcript_6842/m.15647 type:complete len:240 (-) Transcript_6842:1802-2521(-)